MLLAGAPVLAHSEGDDTAGGVESLPDGRIAVVGTIQLETQRKMALIVTNPNGRFSD